MRSKKISAILILVAITFLLPQPAAFTHNPGSSLVRQDMPDSTGSIVSNGRQQPDYLYSDSASVISPGVPNDSYFDKQWALTKIQALDAWQFTSGSQDIRIAVLDTGIDLNHEDLAGKVVASVNFTDSPIDADLNGHGTHIAGIIAANMNNNLGITGLVPDCQLLNVKVIGDDGKCKAFAVAEGIIWAVDHGARVINLSLTFIEPQQILEEAVNYAWSKGVVVVAAAGNDGDSTPMYPAYYANCLAVTTTNMNDLLDHSANYGAWVDVAAPGVSIYSTLPDNGYGYSSGTSMSTAYLTGVAGLLFTVATDVNGNGRLNDEVRHMIESSCDQVGVLDVANGRINALKAVR